VIVIVIWLRMVSRRSYRLGGLLRIRARAGLANNPPIRLARAALSSAPLPSQFLGTKHIRYLSQKHVAQKVPDVSFEADTNIPIKTPSSEITAVRTSSTRKFVTIEFPDATFTFHSQWLHDAQTDDGPYKQVADTYTHKNSFVEVQNASISGHGIKTTLDVSWKDGRSTRFPSLWLRVYAPLVAEHHGNETAQKELQIPKGWLVHTLKMPEISFSEIFPEVSCATALRIHEILVHDSFPGILKVTDLPPPIAEDERKGKNTILARVLTQVFGSVFSHPRRGPNVAYTMASHQEQYSNKGKLLPNYNTAKLLLPHFDQSIYQNPTRVDGLYNLEGESENTFVSCPAVLQTLSEESPELVDPLFTAPMAFGRVAHMYSPPQYQASTPTAVMSLPGFPRQVYRFRWNPHQVGSLLSPFAQFPTALRAHRKFQEVASRDSHRLKVRFRPGDMYLWDNFKVLHGRERVLVVPRTGVGQTVPEQAVLDGWREMLTGKLLRVFEERWLVHVPLAQLYELDKIVDALQS
jgi:trimethyllysine dioxygenase